MRIKYVHRYVWLKMKLLRKYWNSINECCEFCPEQGKVNNIISQTNIRNYIQLWWLLLAAGLSARVLSMYKTFQRNMSCNVAYVRSKLIFKLVEYMLVAHFIVNEDVSKNVIFDIAFSILISNHDKIDKEKRR